jgi:Xaa-Pro dipeptidase
MSVTPLIKVNVAMFAEQRKRLGAALAAKLGDAATGSVALVEASSGVARNASDTEFMFRQDSYFQHLFGYETADCLGAVEPGTGTGMLFVPRHPDSHAVWMGNLETCAEIKAKTGAEEVHFMDEIDAVLAKRGVQTIHVMSGNNTDSGLAVRTAHFGGQGAFVLEKSVLFDMLNDLRSKKTAMELDFFGEVNAMASKGHVAMMQFCKPGVSQYHLEATFTHYCMMNGCRQLAYGPICATGADCAVLHYVENNKPCLDGQMALMDLGGEYKCYASDITTSFPVNGKYTPEQAAIYNGVLAAHDAVIAAMKPGVSWEALHRLAMRTIGGALRDLDLVRGTDDELEAAEVMQKFMPHGLGHLIGIDVHDAGGYAPHVPRRPKSILCNRLRTARIMEAGLVITVEPGCYFNAVLLNEAFKNDAIKHFFNEAKIREEVFWAFGGVRIESNVAVTATGSRNFTKVPRKVADVEAVMAGGAWTE